MYVSSIQANSYVSLPKAVDQGDDSLLYVGFYLCATTATAVIIETTNRSSHLPWVYLKPQYSFPH